jgi:hypothetical protein
LAGSRLVGEESCQRFTGQKLRMRLKFVDAKTWMPGTRPGMTERGVLQQPGHGMKV